MPAPEFSEADTKVTSVNLLLHSAMEIYAEVVYLVNLKLIWS